MKVQKKFTDAVAQASQMAKEYSFIPAI